MAKPPVDKPKSIRRAPRRPEEVTLTKAGVAVGVGSAALVAALLYAGRPKRQKPAK